MQLEDRESQDRLALSDPTPDIVLVEGSHLLVEYCVVQENSVNIFKIMGPRRSQVE